MRLNGRDIDAMQAWKYEIVINLASGLLKADELDVRTEKIDTQPLAA